MTWLLFLDESGHDHKNMPYEVYGGVAIHVSRLWGFIQSIRTLEQSLFGSFLRDFGSEIKGSKLLTRDRFKWERQGTRLEPQALRKHALNFLNSSAQRKPPRKHEFTAFGQASIRLAEELCTTLRQHEAKIFAAFTPPIPRPKETRSDVPRKDMVFLLERFYYFLRESNSHGLLVLDRTDNESDAALVKRIESYYRNTMTGSRRAELVVPAPLFVESDMAYGVQAADVCIYILNWGYRFGQVDKPVRPEIRDFANLLEPMIWRADITEAGRSFQTHSVVYVGDPYNARAP